MTKTFNLFFFSCLFCCNRYVFFIVYDVHINVINLYIFPQNGEIERKHQQEIDQKKVANQMAELKMAKRELEQEVDTHKTRLRLHMEAQVRLTVHKPASLSLGTP